MRLGWVAAALVAVAIAGVSRLSFEGDIFRLLPGDLPQVRGLRVFLENFSQPGRLLVTVSGSDAGVVEEAVRRIAVRLEGDAGLAPGGVVFSPPWESQPESLVEIAAFLALNRGTEEFQVTLEGMAAGNRAGTLEQSMRRLSESVSPAESALLSNDPYRLVCDALPGGAQEWAGSDGFANAKGTFRVLYVETEASGLGYRDLGRTVDGVAEAAAEAVEGLDVRLGFTGEPAFVAGISRAMERDMVLSGGVALVLVGFVFWVCYGRLRPLAGLILLLLFIFAITLGVGGLISGTLTAIGAGCAAILIGLSVDYGYFVFERSRGFQGSVAELRVESLKTLSLTAGTTAAAFFMLDVSGLPGLSQLGLLVGIGVVVGLGVMVLFFAPMAMRWRSNPSARELALHRYLQSSSWNRNGAVATGVVVSGCLAVLAMKGPPAFDFSPESLRPGNTPAYAVLETLTRELAGEREVLNLLVEGDSVEQVRGRLEVADRALSSVQKRGDVLRFQTALDFWPRGRELRKNLALAAAGALSKEELKQAAFDAGFTREAFALHAGILNQWEKWNASGMPDLPENPSSRWILGRFAKVAPGGGFFASGYVVAAPGREVAVAHEIAADGVLLTGWPLLGHEIAEVLAGGLLHLTLGLAVAVLGVLGITLRSVRRVVVFAVAIALSTAALLGAMSIAGISWNIFSLAAVLLLLGTGTDYSMLMLLALKRQGGDVAKARREVALVIALCALSAVAGFGSVGFSTHAGLATLGKVAAIGLALNAAVALFLVPMFERRVCQPAPSTNRM